MRGFSVWKNKITVFITPTTHWDREWVMTHGQYQVRLVHLVDRLLELLYLFPHYRFLLDGQFIILEDYLAIKPEKRTEIATFLANHQLVAGPWYVLSCYQGEMRGSATQPMDLVGTLSSHMPLKQINDQCEVLLQRVLEPLCTITTALTSTAYPTGLVRNLWRMLLINHPHDSICGCSQEETLETTEYHAEEKDGQAPSPLSWQMAVVLLTSIPGISERIAYTILAEIGSDMSRYPTASHLASWSGVCPGNHESVGKRKSGKARKGNACMTQI